MSRVLVIAYGNPLRSDDGLAWRAAEQLQRASIPNLEIVCAHQLTPELADHLRGVDGVVFVDAALDGEPGTLRCESLTTQPGQIRFSHQLAPGQLVTLARQLYDAQPRAFCVSVAGKSFEHGEILSPEISQVLPELVQKLRAVVREIVSA